MARTACKILGFVFLLVGLLGFVMPGVLGMHLGMAHNIIHLLSGGAALAFAFKGTYHGIRTFCLVFGAVYGLLGLVGFVSSGPGGMLLIAPGYLELGLMDHIVHLLLGIVFVGVGLATSKVQAIAM